MSSSTRVSQSRGRLGARLAAAAGIAALCITAVPATSASAAASVRGAVMLQNGRFKDAVLCASADNNGVWMMSLNAAKGNDYCHWKQFGPDGHFTLYNLGKDEVMAYHGGNESPVVMEPAGSSGGNAESWSWGGWEGGDWQAAALQSFLDSGQNVDARSPYLDERHKPRTDRVRTRGWRHGDQRELTWSKIEAS
ncbi:hypothetical protein [Streptomyces torulosus]|uniref:hypothetical protein n=1 Tax=Streptomyces torulosus TaxID=68276 RepID=UPI000B1A1C78|nr:hypothetical protein [Streptomyces torulosus]